MSGVWEINVRQIIIIANCINSQTSKLQTALAWVLGELERNQKRENYLKMMGTLFHVQLYTFSYRKAVIQPQNMPKIADQKVKIRVP